MDIITILVVIIVLVSSFFIGRKTVKHKEKLSYEKELAELDKLNDKIEYENSKIQSLKDEYEERRLLNKQYELDCELSLSKKVQLLDDQYRSLKDEKEKEFQEFNYRIQEEKEKVKSELNSLKSTRAATVESFRREQQIKDNLDAYRLDISEQDKRDIALLDSIKLQLSKPRILSMLIWQTYYQPIAKKKFPIILGSDTVCGIYKIENSISEESYIGQAVDVKKRFFEHCKFGLGIDTPQGSKLYNAMIRDGLYNFTFTLLEECSREELNEKEKYYIALYNSCEFGYNSNRGISE